VFFALACVLIFAFSFVREGRVLDGTAAGILWVTVTLQARSRSAARSSASGRARRCALLLAPIERPAVYLGKLLGLVVLMFGVGRSSCPSSACSTRRSAARHGCWRACW
jgi:ABC-type transport system involved in cytochrome c biogenesis permease component